MDCVLFDVLGTADAPGTVMVDPPILAKGCDPCELFGAPILIVDPEIDPRLLVMYPVLLWFGDGIEGGEKNVVKLIPCGSNVPVLMAFDTVLNSPCRSKAIY